MSETAKTNQQLYERVFSAESALKNAREVLTMHIEKAPILDKIDAHVDKYITPKDPLFEKFCEFIGDSYGPDTNRSYRKGKFEDFKEMFKEELNGTKGLDEAIEYCTRYKCTCAQAIYEIKERRNHD